MEPSMDDFPSIPSELEDDVWEDRPKVRWAPLGAANTDEEVDSLQPSKCSSDAERLRDLEAEQEQLNGALLALTTHFAQFQFRVQQIVGADPNEQDALLRDLEEFAFKGIPDVQSARVDGTSSQSSMSDYEIQEKVVEQKERQHKLIAQLKTQLEELENYAYETGDAGLPSNVVLEKQKVILDELKRKLSLNVDDLDKLSPEELRNQVDRAVGQLVNPLKMKEQLVDQLKTQIADLERFVQFLQVGESNGSSSSSCTCKCPVHETGSNGNRPNGRSREQKPQQQNKSYKGRAQRNEQARQTIHIMKRMLTMLQIFTIHQFGCGGPPFQRNTLKKTQKGNHWGDLRANLEVAIEHTYQLAKQRDALDSDCTSDSDSANPQSGFHEQLTIVVRKELATALRDLLQHGLMPMGSSKTLVPFLGCIPNRSANAGKMMHIWEIFLKYYQLRNGEKFNSTPARRLSQSFGLSAFGGGGGGLTNKQALLSVIGNIISTHTPLKRSNDSHFKAFVCEGLNSRKLIPWIRLVIRTESLLESYYQPWSYVISTGFEDSFTSLEKLSRIEFDLPADLAVRQFTNIRDAF